MMLEPSHSMEMLMKSGPGAGERAFCSASGIWISIPGSALSSAILTPKAFAWKTSISNRPIWSDWALCRQKVRRTAQGYRGCQP